MSHFTRHRTQLRHQEHLEQALANLGYQVRHDSAVRGWARQATRAEIVVTPRGTNYDIGFVRPAANEPFEIVADWMGTGVTQPQFQLAVEREYALVAAEDGARRDGWRNLTRETQADGTIVIAGTRPY